MKNSGYAVNDSALKYAAAYLRVSTEEQDEYSLDSQLKLIREYALKNGFHVPNEYVFVDDGISGRTAAKRDAFQRMIALAKSQEHPFDAILIWKFSRFARNQEESIVYKSALNKCKVEVVSISEPLPEGPFSSLIERIIEWMDEFYSIRLSGEVKRGMIERASRGQAVCSAPFGYSLEKGSGKTYTVNNDEAPIVREIFERYLAGDGMREISISLGARGITTHRGNHPENRWIEYILNNPVYIGKIRWSKDGRAASKRDYENENVLIYDGAHEAIISSDLWNAVQKKLAEDKLKYQQPKARRNEPVMWPLKGLVKCSNCGATICYSNVGEGTMQCHNYSRGKCDISHSMYVKKAMRLIIEAMQNAVDNMSFNIEPVSSKKGKSSAPDVEKLIAKEKRKLERILQAYENGIDTLEEYAEKKKRVMATLSELEAQEKVSDLDIDLKQFALKVQSVIDLLSEQKASEKAKNEALRSVLSKIVFDRPNNKFILYFYA